MIDYEFAPGEEFPEGGPAAIRNLDTDPLLRIQHEEPESWQQNWSPEDREVLTQVEVKRQEHIYEFIATESNHCQVLRIIQKVRDFWKIFSNFSRYKIYFFSFQIFIEGMYKYLNMSKEVVDRIFPCVDELVDIHFKFLEQLRIRQNEKPVVDSIADILLDQFSGRKWFIYFLWNLYEYFKCKISSWSLASSRATS